MSDATLQRYQKASSRVARSRGKVPPGYGLLLAVAVSLGLWAALIWLALKLLG